MNKAYYIYALADPRDINHIRYVGFTTQPLHIRLSNHVCNSRNKADKNFKKEWWIRSLLKEGLKPSIYVLKQLTSREEMLAEEIKQIKKAKKDGHKIFNVQDGGISGYKRNPNRDKSQHKYKKVEVHKYSLSGKFIESFDSCKDAAESVGCSKSLITMSAKDEVFTRVGAGFYWRYFKVDKIAINIPPHGMTGKKRSEEYKRQASERNKNYKPTEEAKAKQAEAQKIPIKQMDANGNVIKIWPSQRDVRLELGIKLYSSRFPNKIQHKYFWDWA
jgi:hypothetical protein